MSVLFAFECISEQRRGIYCNFLSWKWCLLPSEPRRFAGDFPVTSLAARGTWPHGVTFSRSAEICPSGKPWKKTKLQNSCKKRTSEHYRLVFLSHLGLLFVRSGWRRREERGCARSFQLLSQWPGDAWHPSAPRLALGSSDQEKQDGCLCHIQDIFHHKDETWEVCNLLPGIISAWVCSSKLLRWDNWQDN